MLTKRVLNRFIRSVNREFENTTPTTHFTSLSYQQINFLINNNIYLHWSRACIDAFEKYPDPNKISEFLKFRLNNFIKRIGESKIIC
jgi:hypothetical protein